MKPILFNTAMVRAILAENKTCTRMLVKPQPDERHSHALGFVHDSTDKKDIGNFGFGTSEYGGSILYAKPPYRPGDILYVRETWRKTQGVMHKVNKFDRIVETSDIHYGYEYRASVPGEPWYYFPDGFKQSDSMSEMSEITCTGRWRPSIQMPKKAARIFLRVTDVRVERLQEIDADGILAEGLCTAAAWVGDMEIATQEYVFFWDGKIKSQDIDKYGWKANPWVWVIEFERIKNDYTRVNKRFD